MLIGLVSDIHGNTAALSHALDLLHEAQMLVCLGDSINQHRFSNETVRLLRERAVLTIWGNHEAAFFSGVASGRSLPPWVDRDLSSWLEQRPVRIEQDVGGRRVLIVHSTALDPLGDYVAGEGPKFQSHFGGTRADIILCGHTHLPGVRRTSDGTVVINPGSVGEGRPSETGFIANCALLETEGADVRFFEFMH